MEGLKIASRVTTRSLDLKNEIARLQEELQKEERKGQAAPSEASQNLILAPTTPSPKKRKCELPIAGRAPLKLSYRAPASKATLTRVARSTSAQPPAGPSNYLTSLSTLTHENDEEESQKTERSSGFSAPPAPATASNPEQRDDRLRVIEQLEIGPRDHPIQPDDPDFLTREPNSGIYLNERKLSHDDFQEHLRGRYFIPPSLLYAIARPLPGNQGYDVPVDGDWVTAAVIAERGLVKLTSTPHTGEAGENKVSSKKFLTLKLVDLGMNNSSSLEKGTRGDALLNLLLFEATSSSKEVTKGTSSDRFAIKHYKGGSGGAFEACAALREGTILAIMNPRILKPFKKGEGSSKAGQILAITPTSADSLLVLGQARDLGSCSVTKRDGSVCGSWYDKRSSGGRSVCEWHFASTVQGQRNSRAEFSTSTSTLRSGPGLSSFGRRPDEDAKDKKEGLLPKHPQRGSCDGEAIYMYSGTTIRPGGAGQVVEEKIGRGRQERLKRKREALAAENALTKLQTLQPDDRAAISKVKVAQSIISLGQGSKSASTKPLNESNAGQEPENTTSLAYSSFIKNLGFNPGTKTETRGKGRDADVRQRLDNLRAASINRAVQLGARPGRKHSSLAIPRQEESKSAPDNIRFPLDDLDSDIEIEDEKLI